jgi:hypothetical protein
MPAHRAPEHAVAAAIQAVEDGATIPEAAEAAGIGRATLERRLAERRKAQGGRGGKKAPATKPAAPRGGKTPRGATAGSSQPVEGGGTRLQRLERLLDAALAEEEEAAPGSPARRQWSERAQKLWEAVNRHSPPAPVPPDAVAEALSELDAVCLEDLERNLPNPITPAEVAAARATMQ